MSILSTFLQCKIVISDLNADSWIILNWRFHWRAVEVGNRQTYWKYLYPWKWVSVVTVLKTTDSNPRPLLSFRLPKWTVLFAEVLHVSLQNLTSFFLKKWFVLRARLETYFTPKLVVLMLEYIHEQDWKGRKYNWKIVGWKGLWQGSTVLAAIEITSCESWVHSGRQQLQGCSSECG